MATGPVTTTSAAKFVQESWTQEVQKPYYDQLYFKGLITDRSALVQKGSNKLNVPFLTKYSASDKSAGTAVTFTNNTEEEVEISINKHKYCAIMIEDFARAQANYDLATLYRGAQSEAIAEAVDTDLGSLHASAGTNVACGAAMDDADILSSIYALDAANVPPTQRHAIISAKPANDLRSVDKYTQYSNTGEKGLSASGTANVANVYGIDISMSNNIVDDATSTHNQVFHKAAISMAEQIKPTYKIEDSVDYIAVKTVLHTSYGFGLERSTSLVDMERDS